MQWKRKLLCFVVMLALLTACSKEEPEEKLFTLLSPEQTNIHFTNQLAESAQFNILKYLYYYNGGGVAAGDINNDGLPDLYFTASELPNKLYLNLGNLRFKEVTEEAGVAGLPGWTTGVTMVDVNGDGWLDLYVSQLSEYEGLTGHNQLYINQADTSRGYPVFSEQAEEYGLAARGFATQAYFFDYDVDGDLDVYLLNHTVHSPETYVPVDKGRRVSKHGDKLLRNDGGVFQDVTLDAGIYSSIVGYGLSASVADINQDGYPDIYVANDFHENDYLYINNGDGSFAEQLEAVIGHTSRFSMGSDIADFNNDAYSDIVTLDMKPENERVLKISAGEDPYDIFQYKLKYGYNHQYARNNLQLNTPLNPGEKADITHVFREIGQYSGISATDWSWAALWADLDNDGWKDLYVTNGILRRPNNLDYTKYISNAELQADLQAGRFDENLGLIDKMPSEAIANYCYQNQGDLTFSNQASEWGLDQPGFSNGAAYADLDNDGDLDLVVNNVNAPAFIYRNNTTDQKKHHFLQIRLEGMGKNTFGIGGKVWLYQNGSVQYQELMPARGFQSSVAEILHFGLGQQAASIDSLVVVWPEGQKQVLTNVTPNRVITLTQTEAVPSTVAQKETETLFQEKSGNGIDFVHRENVFSDVSREPLMPHLLSQEGPALATGDVNGDGLSDLFVGGAANQMSMLFIQKPDGTFIPTNHAVWREALRYEDVVAAFFDADGDSDLDLYVGSAGNEFSDKRLQDRLYLNDGIGNFRWFQEALPPMISNTSCVAPHDFDADGDVDLFVGSRVVTGRYGVDPKSYLLRNDGEGRFLNITQDYAPEVERAGMVTDAVWSDYDQDGQKDLIVVGEWMPITVFRSEEAKLALVHPSGLAHTEGWWNCVEAVDLDGDGDDDLVAGNLGLNSVIRASDDEPATLYVSDFDQNGSVEQILSFYKGGASYPFVTRDELTQQIPSLRKKYQSYADFADHTAEEIFGAETLENAVVKTAYRFASSMFLNQGNGKFKVITLPASVQFAPVRAILPADFNQDGTVDLLLGGNFDAVGPKQGRYDASFGWFLSGDGQGGFQPVETDKSGFFVMGEIMNLGALRQADGSSLIVVGRNDQVLKIFHSYDSEKTLF